MTYMKSRNMDRSCCLCPTWHQQGGQGGTFHAPCFPETPAHSPKFLSSQLGMLGGARATASELAAGSTGHRCEGAEKHVLACEGESEEDAADPACGRLRAPSLRHISISNGEQPRKPANQTSFGTSPCALALGTQRPGGRPSCT